MENLQLYSRPRCFFMQNHLAQPDDHHPDPGFETLILTFAVRLSALHSDTDAVYHRCKFSEPLAVVTSPHNESAARSKLYRMLDSMQVPHSRPGPDSDLVTEILEGVRDGVFFCVEYPQPTTLRVLVKIDICVLRLPQVLEPESERCRDGPPIYLDGADSKDYQKYNVRLLDHNCELNDEAIDFERISLEDGDDNLDESDDGVDFSEDNYESNDESDNRARDLDFDWDKLVNYLEDIYDNWDDKVDEPSNEAVDPDHDFHWEAVDRDHDFHWDKLVDYLEDIYDNGDDKPNGEAVDHDHDHDHGFDFYWKLLFDYLEDI